MEFEIKNHNTIYIRTPQMKYLGVNLTKYVQDLYEEYNKSMMKEIKELDNWRDIL